MKDEVITIRLSTTTLEAVKYLAEFHDVTVPEVVRKALDDYIGHDYTMINCPAIKNSLSNKWRKAHE